MSDATARPPTPEPLLRPATAADRSEVQDLICVSLNYWYRSAGRPAVVTGGPDACAVFWDVYEALDPGCCLVAEEPRTGRLMGACFYHVRPTHVSVGIMVAHPNYFGRGVAARLLRFVTDEADRQHKPVRLVSSAMNLDSYSLYTRAGFHPRALYQDVVVPAGRARAGLPGAGAAGVRPATAADVPAIADLEWQVSGIRREQDWRHFVDNASGIWHVAVREAAAGGLAGTLASVDHPGSFMLGPGVMRDDTTAAALIASELTRLARKGGESADPAAADRALVFLVPADRPALVRTVYGWGGRNVELHVFQARGDARVAAGVAMPTFMPETG